MAEPYIAIPVAGGGSLRAGGADTAHIAGLAWVADSTGRARWTGRTLWPGRKGWVSIRRRKRWARSGHRMKRKQDRDGKDSYHGGDKMIRQLLCTHMKIVYRLGLRFTINRPVQYNNIVYGK